MWRWVNPNRWGRCGLLRVDSARRALMMPSCVCSFVTYGVGIGITGKGALNSAPVRLVPLALGLSYSTRASPSFEATEM